MRHRLVIALALLAMACGGDSATAPAPQKGTVIFRLDAQTCVGTSTLNFFLDGTIIGTSVISAGQSQTFTNAPSGQHVLGASEAKVGGYVWTPTTATIPPGGTYTHMLFCL